MVQENDIFAFKEYCKSFVYDNNPVVLDICSHCYIKMKLCLTVVFVICFTILN